MISKTCKVLENKRLAPGTYTMVLDGRGISSTAVPGQFIMLGTGKGTGGPLLKRPFSIHRIGPNEKISVLYRVVGQGTELLSKAQPNDELAVIGPLGRGFDSSLAKSVAYLVAGGIGAAPMFALAEVLMQKVELKIFYGVKFANEYVDVFEELLSASEKNAEFSMGGYGEAIEKSDEQDKNRVELIKASEDGLLERAGLVTDYLALALHSDPAPVYACGPKPMLAKVAELADSVGVEAQVSLEAHMACGIGACLGCVAELEPGNEKSPNYGRVCKEGPVFNTREVKW